MIVTIYIIFTADSSGHKYISGFKSKIDEISFESYLIRPENLLYQDGSTIIKLKSLEILFENELVDYEDLIIVGYSDHLEL